jgi:hypothetical protein
MAACAHVTQKKSESQTLIVTFVWSFAASTGNLVPGVPFNFRRAMPV